VCTNFEGKWVEVDHRGRKIGILRRPTQNNYSLVSKNQCIGLKPKSHEVYLLLLKLIQNRKREFLVGKQNEELEPILNKYTNVFPSEISKSMQPMRDFNHSINLVSRSSPCLRVPYGMSKIQYEEIQRQAQDLLAQRYIVPSISPFGALVLLIDKKVGLN